MNLTLYKRREKTTTGEGIKKFLDQSLWFSNIDQVLQAFNCISHITIKENFTTFLSENEFGLLSMTGSLKTKPELFNSLKGADGQYASNCMIILGLILAMNQDINHLIGDEVPG